MLLEELGYESHHLLTVWNVTLPDTVAAHYYEIVGLVAIGFSYLRDTGHALLVVTVLLTCLVLEISKGSRKTQSTINSALANKPTGLLDSVVLWRQIRFVICRQRHSRPPSRQYSSRIAYIGHIVFLFGHKEHNCCGSSPMSNHLMRARVGDR